MRVNYIAALVAVSILSVGLDVIFPQSTPAGGRTATIAQSNPCASANPCAGANSPTPASVSAPLVYSDTNGLAIRGTDPVAYFTEGRPIEGSSQFTYQWNGATWRFSSAQNRALFATDPEAYAPQYGGYCAKALSEGNVVSTDPNAWKIVNGKLYLNYSPEVQRQWMQDIPGHILQADANWPKVLIGATVFQ
ncbi:MAG: YHS domain-containing protein [Leptolyngbyaceae cyanobacterium CRU_2_3]|nr:YHS domain-containing protein [Leptolyngbyaceae cyanobacterium CRU_2_3]